MRGVGAARGGLERVGGKRRQVAVGVLLGAALQRPGEQLVKARAAGRGERAGQRLAHDVVHERAASRLVGRLDYEPRADCRVECVERVVERSAGRLRDD